MQQCNRRMVFCPYITVYCPALIEESLYIHKDLQSAGPPAASPSEPFA